MMVNGRILVKSFGNCIGQTWSFSSALRFSTSAQCNMWSKWRQKVGVPRAGNEYGPLTDLPDFTFSDGRRAQLLAGQRRRLIQEMVNAKKIHKLIGEMDFAVEHHRKKVTDVEKAKTDALNFKFKVKGHKFLVTKKPN